MDKIKDILIELEQALRAQGQWSPEPPIQQALASPQPFCYDTLEFNQWLQWVFLPRLNTLVEANAILPSESAIYEYAEEVYQGAGYDTVELLRVIKSFDEMIVAKSSAD